MNGSAAHQLAYDTRTAFHHMRAVFGQGIVAAIYLFNEYIARKQLGATRWHILLFLLVPALFQFVAVVWNPADPRGRFGRSPFRLLGVPSCLLLLLPWFVPALRGASALIAVLVLCQSVSTMLVPAQNAVLAKSYTDRTRGMRFGWAVSVQALAIIAISLPAGMLLDRHPHVWPMLYAIAAFAGLYGFLHWGRLYDEPAVAEITSSENRESPWQVLRHNREFLLFEGSFMIYGLGFLMMLPVLPIYLVDELKITYSQVSLARGVIFWVVMVLVSPFLGKLADRVGVLKVAALSFFALAFFSLVLLFVGGTTGLYIAFAVYGLAMGGVNVAWNLGPIAMAGDRNPLPYLNVHLALVGIRALIGMVGGTYLQYALGSRSVFWCAAALEVLAALAMLALVRSNGRKWAVALPIPEGAGHAANCGR